MELVSIEQSQLVSLFSATRPSGQLYIPDAASALAERYSFVEVPTKFADVDSLEFKLGKFGDSAIDSLKIYNDGVIIVARSNMAILEAFFDDAMDWFARKFSIVRTETTRTSRTFDSHIVVDSKVDLLQIVQGAEQICRLVSQPLKETTGIDANFETMAVLFGPDATKMPGDDLRPHVFRVERRAGLPFSDNRFYSHAPLRTNDHLKVLESLENLV